MRACLICGKDLVPVDLSHVVHSGECHTEFARRRAWQRRHPSVNLDDVPPRRMRPKRWTEFDEHMLGYNWGSESIETIQRSAGRSASSLRHKARGLGLRSSYAGTFRLRDLEEKTLYNREQLHRIVACMGKKLPQCKATGKRRQIKGSRPWRYAIPLELVDEIMAWIRANPKKVAECLGHVRRDD